MDALLETTRSVVGELFAINSIWSIVFRGVIWFGVAIVIIVSVDSASSGGDLGKLKSNLGFFFMFLILSTTLIYLLFGFSGTEVQAAG